jgi:hypothetical protein
MQVGRGKSRRRIVAALAVALVAPLPGAAVSDSTAATLTTPSLPVTTPTVPVKTSTPPPPAPVTPPPPIKTPTVPVKTPTVPVKTPTVKTPSVPVKTPTAPVKTPPVKAPTVTVKAPTVTVKTPAAPSKTTAPRAVTVPSVKAPSPPSVSGDAKRLPVSPAPIRQARSTTGATSIVGTLAATTSAAGTRLARAGALVASEGALRSAAQGTTGLSGYLGAPGAPTGAPGGAMALTPKQIERLLRHGRAMLDNPHVRAFVLELQACLGELPPQLQRVLRLRTGIAERRPSSARAVARRLHISRKRLRILEVRALRRLTTAARTTGCATRASAAAVLPGLVRIGFVSDYTGGAAGGVAGGLYFKEASEPGAETVPPAEAIPSPTLRVAQGSDVPLIWALVAALAGALLIVALIRSDMGLGPSAVNRRLRRRYRRSGRPRRRED